VGCNHKRPLTKLLITCPADCSGCLAALAKEKIPDLKVTYVEARAEFVQAARPSGENALQTRVTRPLGVSVLLSACLNWLHVSGVGAVCARSSKPLLVARGH
jgi:hypothetical protein